jgi:hypothetical protein
MLKKLLNLFFFRKQGKEYTPKKIIIWWEIRRIPFNILFACFSFIATIAASLIFEPGGGGSPVILLLIYSAILILVNIYYTIFWIVDLLLGRKSKASSARKNLFILSVLLIFILTIIVEFEVYINAYYRGWVDVAF